MADEAHVALAKYRLEKASADLAAAKQTYAIDLYDVAANRSYYAIFHAARAALCLQQQDYSRHSGVIAFFRKNYIKATPHNSRRTPCLIFIPSSCTDFPCQPPG